MVLTSLTVRAFRAHSDTRIDPSPGVNVLFGPNGAGKTNLLEALSFLSYGKSFLSAPDSNVVQRGQSVADVTGEFQRIGGVPIKVRVAFSTDGSKRAFVNGAPLDRLSELIGRVPLVVFSPQDSELTAGGPSARRRFLDLLLSQASPAYFRSLVAYRRALRQRNALLDQLKSGRALPPGTMDAWDAELSLHGSAVVSKRIALLETFQGHLRTAYDLLGSPGAPPSLAYRDTSGVDPGLTEPHLFSEALSRTLARSRQLRRTVVGPHLDEVEMRLGEFLVRPFASQGQHRTLAVMIRLAEALYLATDRDERPILLLDDVFGPLDPVRSDLIRDVLLSGQLGQSFVSSASGEPFKTGASFHDDGPALFHVEQGSAHPISPLPPDPSSYADPL